MHLSRLLLRSLTLLVLLIGSGGPAYAAVCAGTDAAPALCPPGTGPCVVSTICSLPSGFVADLGPRPLVIQANKSITIPEPGLISIKANGITLEGGAKILADGAGTPNVHLFSTSTTTGIVMDISSRITTGSRGDGGIVDLRSDGPVVMRGQLRAQGPNSPDVGGNVSITALGDVRIDGSGSTIDVSGGLDGFGGYVDIATLGTVTIQSSLKMDGGEGGALSIDTEGDVVVKTGTLIDVDATLGGGYAGEVDIAGRDVQMAGTVEGAAKREDDGSNDPTFSGGDGAAVSVLATANIAIDATVDIKGGPGGTGGDFELDAVGNVSVLGKVLARAEGRYGSGSDSVAIWSENGNVTVGATLDVAGGWSGGAIEVMSFAPGGTVTLTGAADLSAAALGLPIDDPYAGTIDLDACVVQVQSGAAISTAGTNGINTLRARTSMVIAGSLRAGRENRLEYRDQSGIITILSPAGQIVPAATVVPNPALSCCGAGCVQPTTTTTAPPSTTTTSTTAPTTSSTSTIPPTTSTTTTSVPPTTTTSTLPPTTTTSVPPTTTTSTIPPTTTTSIPPTTTTSTIPPTTTTSVPPTTTTTTSLPETTSTTTTTTSTSSSTVLSSTSTTVVTTTTTVETPTSTSTTQPSTECADTTEFGGVACSVTRLNTRIEGASTDQLGGKATANRLRAALRRASRYLDDARSGKKVVANLRRAQREMKAIERTVQQGLRRKRNPIDAEVGQGILSLSTEARAEIGVLQTLGR